MDYNFIYLFFFLAESYPFVVGPNNIMRSVEATDVFIPCPVSTTNEAPFWKISGIVYDLYSLPEMYQPQPPLGILLKVVRLEINGTTFQCFYSSATVDGFELKESSIGVLTVVDRAGLNQ